MHNRMSFLLNSQSSVFKLSKVMDGKQRFTTGYGVTEPGNTDRRNKILKENVHMPFTPNISLHRNLYFTLLFTSHLFLILAEIVKESLP